MIDRDGPGLAPVAHHRITAWALAFGLAALAFVVTGWATSDSRWWLPALCGLLMMLAVVIAEFEELP